MELWTKSIKINSWRVASLRCVSEPVWYQVYLRFLWPYCSNFWFHFIFTGILQLLVDDAALSPFGLNIALSNKNVVCPLHSCGTLLTHACSVSQDSFQAFILSANPPFSGTAPSLCCLFDAALSIRTLRWCHLANQERRVKAWSP